MTIILKKKVKGLPYKIGQSVPVNIGNKGQLLWHVATTIIELPIDSYELPTKEFSRKPTADEIKFGHGAQHYKDFGPDVYQKKDGTVKFRLKCPIDGLIYTRSRN